MEIRQLTTFMSLVNTGSFSQTASILGYSQSAISMQMKALEADLGGKLYHYQNHQFTLTTIGQQLVPLGNKLLNNYAEIKALRSEQATKGVLRIAAPESISCFFLPAILRAFKSRLPDVDLEIMNATCLYNEERLIKGEADIAFMLWPMKVNSHLIDRDLGQQEMVLVTGGKYTSQQSLLEDDRATFLTNEAQCSYRNQFESGMWLQHQHQFNTRELASLETIMQMVACDMGFGYVPRFVAAPAIEKDDVEAIETDVTNHIHMHVLTRSDVAENPLIKTFVDVTKTVCGN